MPRAGGFLAELAVEIRGLFALEFFDGDCRGSELPMTAAADPD
jgi:hypothetical protein